MLVINTGLSRDASKVLKQVNIPGALTCSLKRQKLRALRDLAILFCKSLIEQNLELAGKILLDAWLQKRALAPGITLKPVDEAIQTMVRLGAYGAKLLGAGAGGHILVLAPPSVKDKIVEMAGSAPLLFCLTNQGTCFSDDSHEERRTDGIR